MLNAILAIINALNPILARILPDPDKRLEIQKEIQEALVNSQSEIFGAMRDVMVADSTSDSTYTKNARPTIVYWSLGMISVIIVLAPFGYSEVILEALKQVPETLWTLMTVGIGAFTFGRSVEKSAINYKR